MSKTIDGKWKIIRTIELGERLPRWYGLVRHRYEYRDALAAPIPLNLILRWGGDVIWMLRRGLCRTWRERYDERLFNAMLAARSTPAQRGEGQ